MSVSLFTCLWFDGEAEAAMNFYLGIFEHSKVGSIMRWGDTGPGPKGSVLCVDFELDGRRFMAMNGGPDFKINEAHSICVECQTQAEIDHYWSKLLEGGSAMQCGWLKDKFGVAWQIYPRQLTQHLCDNDTARADRVMKAMMQMVKIDLATIEAAYAG